MSEIIFLPDLTKAVIKFKVDGEPVSKERPRFYKGVVYTPTRTRKAEEKIKWIFKENYPRWKMDIKSNFAVCIFFHLKRKSHRDIDNMKKLVLDSFNGLVWLDDSQVDESHIFVMRNIEIPDTLIAIFKK